MDNIGRQMGKLYRLHGRSIGFPLDYVTYRDMPVGWMAAKEHNCLKCQAIHIGPAW